MIVVADTTPLRYLILIEHTHILPALYGRLIVPPAVIAELSRERTPPSVHNWLADKPDWLSIQAPNHPLGILRVLADAGEHGLADLPTAFNRLRKTNFRASEQLLQYLLSRHKQQP